ncbi:L-aspartate oxidase [Oceanicella actignis]|uniref:L-aspartate oxidase n=1 Tax=Oceanicella actignis TaxID=1189325 RepID=A0A1M7U2K3_9RHOB|nr:L-aspartate oxidase [Oceanicella actignis]TYO84978.1 L-aspartate oxidase [Oceanicella actignis]SET86718.1 L-aspartate oxidase [Oceanicella actignis]SHN77226.1 L-aspartate oxidase [Oceanicella actignis]
MDQNDTVRRAEGALIVGAGLAGLFAALKMAPAPCVVLSPLPLGDGASSAWAQGGIAAALAPEDSPALHARDTVVAGAGAVDEAVARSVAEEAAARIEDLLRIGAPFDRDASGRLLQSREAAHSFNRVVRVKGDQAGRAVMDALIAAVRRTPSIRVLEGVSVDDLALSDGRVSGVFARRAGDLHAEPILLQAPAVILAAGGVGGLYAVTTNPSKVRGQGLGMAARAGALIGDPEYVQFHPTGIAVDRDPTPLASEALRGEGALLIDETGARIMQGVHPDMELAPRDVVARALHRHIARGGKAFLDTRASLGPRIAEEFPAVTAYCREAGIDPAREPIPVRPAQHYHMGGVLTDARGRTSLPGLWACGEVACTGLHGANRLASNSLLEALVFAARIAQDAANLAARADPEPAPPPPPLRPAQEGDPLRAAEDAVRALRRTMTRDVGVERDEEGLRRALREISRLERGTPCASRAFLNMTSAATLIAAAALMRRESRGGHCRSDHPEADPAAPARTQITLTRALEIRESVCAEG